MCNTGLIGNLTKHSFKDMLNSEFAKNIRCKLLKGDYKDICNNCHTISDLGDITQRDCFIREDLMPDRVSFEKQIHPEDVNIKQLGGSTTSPWENYFDRK